MIKIELECTKGELEGLAGLIDAGLRATGVRAAKIAALWIDKLQKAIDENKDKAS